MSIPKRVAAIDVSHWHSAYDASYLRILLDLGCDIVGVSDRAERIARDRAERFGSAPFTDYRRMIEATRPEFVIALGRHCDMPETFRFLVDAGIPFIMEKPWGTDADTAGVLREPLLQADDCHVRPDEARNFNKRCSTGNLRVSDE